MEVTAQTTSSLTLNVTKGNAPTDCFYVAITSENLEQDYEQCNCQRNDKREMTVSCIYEKGLNPETCYNITVFAVNKGRIDRYSQSIVYGCTGL